MNITIIIDKSAFQALSYRELVTLNNYYKHNIAPVLVMEILGDLRKDALNTKIDTEVRVRDFANKLFPTKTVVNAYYRSLIVAELTGETISLDGRPSLEVEKFVETEDGVKGSVIKETEEEKAIYKWKTGHFTEADSELSALWRAVTTQEDKLKNLQRILQSKKIKRLKSFEELSKSVDEALSNFGLQDKWLEYIINSYSDGEIIGSDVFQKWQNVGRPLMSKFLPYSYHCLKVDLMFTLALQSELIGVRPTNLVDSEYLYYIPFCNIFTSDDKFHKQLIPLLIDDNQRFIKGVDMKNDLKTIIDYLDKTGDAAKKEFASKPPLITSSLTFKLWKEYFDYPNNDHVYRELSEKELENMKQKMDMFEKASRGNSIPSEGREEQNFIIKKSKLNINDPCLCGSGKKVRDCCIPPEKFIEIIKEQRMNK